MKNKTLILFALGLLLAIACKKESSTTAPDLKTPQTNTQAVVANPKTTVFTINGMTCAMGCAKTIEQKLATLDGVQKASVNFDTKQATVTYDSNKQTADKLAQLVESVADGKTYKVSDIK